ncbi:putative DNA-binding protein (MmcQ/YjbR family) [Arcticibacter pallidicorallinus]|uniref:Putative DNA-binding protein (MmcQ/YjbR family) n=1 Tax=Arcticibacter pallidicorallinus TaxID=1259464 RepID=A0A2T0U7J6_9SPHI|nr:MmcQ/YjbR family DNA-binding protein [Arcticibacter pallidicorallinus]PRY53884.1 putative DNA-binding protein (MmcQ/YjbR family) [Arcticibacter pallidicorallinus]
MNIEDYREFCLSLKGTTEGFPFGDDTLVVKVKDKVFSLASLEPFSFNVKCDPEKAIELRELYPDVLPGYHMNKRHWNTIQISGAVPDELLRQWIRDSYDLVVGSLPKKTRMDL